MNATKWIALRLIALSASLCLAGCARDHGRRDRARRAARHAVLLAMLDYCTDRDVQRCCASIPALLDSRHLDPASIEGHTCVVYCGTPRDVRCSATDP